MNICTGSSPGYVFAIVQVVVLMRVRCRTVAAIIITNTTLIDHVVRGNEFDIKYSAVCALEEPRPDQRLAPNACLHHTPAMLYSIWNRAILSWFSG